MALQVTEDVDARAITETAERTEQVAIGVWDDHAVIGLVARDVEAHRVGWCETLLDRVLPSREGRVPERRRLTRLTERPTRRGEAADVTRAAANLVEHGTAAIDLIDLRARQWRI